MSRIGTWVPAVILWAGVLLVRDTGGQQRMPLRVPLADAVPAQLVGMHATDYEITPEERRVAGMSSYVMRTYDAGQGPEFSLYIAYYDSQTQGKTIHSPRNCLPGAGWEPLTSSLASVDGPDGPVAVNRYLIQNGTVRALVLYWYQGRGRITANEYAVKWDLLRDAALSGRSEEALVRVIVPVRTTEDASFDLATRIASAIVPAVFRALPEV